jgi:hypothetical protein
MVQQGQIPAPFHQLVIKHRETPEKIHQLEILGTLLFSPENLRNRTYLLTGSAAIAFWAEYYAPRFAVDLEYRLPRDLDVMLPHAAIGDFAAYFPLGFFEVPASTPCRLAEIVDISRPTTLVAQSGAYSIDLFCFEGQLGISPQIRAEMSLPVVAPTILLGKVLRKYQDLVGDVENLRAHNNDTAERCRQDIRTLRQILFLIQEEKMIPTDVDAKTVVDSEDDTF